MKLAKSIAGLAIAAAFAMPAHALVNVQGVQWDPASTDPLDFQAAASLTQWYQTTTDPLNPNNGFNPTGSVATFLNPFSLVGTYLTGAGKFATINGVNNIAGDPNPETNPDQFAPGKEVTYIFGGILITGANVNGGNVSFTFDLSSSFINVFSDSARNYAESSISLAEQLDAADTTFAEPFLTGYFETFGVASNLLNNGNLAGFAEGLISVNGGAAFDNFNTNDRTLGNVVADLSFTGSTQSNVGSQKSTVGTSEIQGNTVPEPGTLLLAGGAMFLASAAARRRRKN